MGGSSWSNAVYDSNVTRSKDLHGTSFVYSKGIREGRKEKKVHELLDPKGVDVRESRDSEAHPKSNAIMVGLDITGSMYRVIHDIHEKLPTLMGLLTRKDYIQDPQIMFSAIGDATCDNVPLQVGQFESGVEMEGDLSRFYLEGGGGGQMTESYELFAYFGARHTAIDCLEKRGKRGYCFIIGDEKSYPEVKANELKNVLGKGAEANLNTQEIFRELQKKYFTFFILPEGASHGHDKSVVSHWGELLGTEHVLQLDDPSCVAELIATQIGLCEGTTDVDTAVVDLKEHGSSEALVKVVRDSVSPAYMGGSVTKVESGVLTSDGDSDVKRL